MTRAALLVAAAAALAAGCSRGPGGPPPGGDRERLADALRRARGLEGSGDARAAEAAWEEVLALRPGHASALYATAIHRRNRGESAGALARLRALRAEEPLAGRGCLLAVEILSDPASGPLRDLAAAEAEARTALALNPEESGPHLALGRVLLLRGDAGAGDRLAVAARMNPRDPESRSLLGVVQLRAGRGEEARRSFAAALRSAAPPGAAAAVEGGIPGEGDTRASLAPGRAPAPGVLRAAAGLAALGVVPRGARDGGEPPTVLRAAAEEALGRTGGGEAVLDRDGDGRVDAAAVRGPDGAALFAAWDGVELVVHGGR